jgi:hypothetical protein
MVIMRGIKQEQPIGISFSQDETGRLGLVNPRGETMARRRRSPIRIKPSNRGKLRKTAGVKKGKKIPVSTLRRLKRSKNPVTRRRATFALNARSWKRGGSKKRRRLV